jgi:hypothetical protein
MHQPSENAANFSPQKFNWVKRDPDAKTTPYSLQMRGQL